MNTEILELTFIILIALVFTIAFGIGMRIGGKKKAKNEYWDSGQTGMTFFRKY